MRCGPPQHDRAGPRMPFTLAHPAFVLPLRRRWPTAFVALVLGSMGPDLPYFLPGRLHPLLPQAHTPLGSVTLGPLYALVMLVAVVVLRPVLVAPLWDRHRVLVDALLLPYARTLRPWLHAVPALVLGSALHYACDSATHRYGWIVGALPALEAPLIVGESRPLPVFSALQYASSLLGLALMAWWYVTELRAAPPPAVPDGRSSRWELLSLAVVSAGLGIRAARDAGPAYGSVHGQLYKALTVGTASFAMLYVVLGCTLLYARRGRLAGGP